MDIINESEFTTQELTEQTLKCVKLAGKRLWVMIFITLAFAITGVVFAIVFASKNLKYSDFLLIAGCFLILLLMLLYFKIFYPRSIKKNYDNTFGDSIKYKFTFHINRVDCELNSLKEKSKGTFNYDSLTKIVEENGIIRLYIAKRNFLPVKISGFVPDEFIKIQKAMQNSKTKYIIKNTVK